MRNVRCYLTPTSVAKIKMTENSVGENISENFHAYKLIPNEVKINWKLKIYYDSAILLLLLYSRNVYICAPEDM